MDGLKEVINQGAFGVLVNGGCLASKQEGNEWSHSVRGPPASAAARVEYRELLIALLVVDETNPTRHSGFITGIGGGVNCLPSSKHRDVI